MGRRAALGTLARLRQGGVGGGASGGGVWWWCCVQTVGRVARCARSAGGGVRANERARVRAFEEGMAPRLSAALRRLLDPTPAAELHPDALEAGGGGLDAGAAPRRARRRREPDEVRLVFVCRRGGGRVWRAALRLGRRVGLLFGPLHAVLSGSKRWGGGGRAWRREGTCALSPASCRARRALRPIVRRARLCRAACAAPPAATPPKHPRVPPRRGEAPANGAALGEVAQENDGE